MKTTIQNEQIPFEVRHSSDASRIRLTYSNGIITIILPERNNQDPEKAVRNNKDWVLDKWDKAKQFRNKTPKRNFEKGETFSVLGIKREIVVEKRRSNTVKHEKIYLAEHLVNQTSLKNQLEKTLREYCREIIHEKLDCYIEEINGSYERVYIRDQSTRWGSCSSKNNLNFNWRLILGPEHVLEYVVIHEIVHLEIPNHSEKFWDRVEELNPGAEDSRKWLKKNSAKLVFDPAF